MHLATVLNLRLYDVPLVNGFFDFPSQQLSAPNERIMGATVPK
jgi:hypothetical protein